MDQTPAWADELWRDLKSRSTVEQIRLLSDWTTYVTNELLTRLADERRILVAKQLLLPGWDAQRLAEVIGSRKVAIGRLAEEGRRLIREQGVMEDVREEEAEEGSEGV